MIAWLSVLKVSSATALLFLQAVLENLISVATDAIKFENFTAAWDCSDSRSSTLQVYYFPNVHLFPFVLIILISLLTFFIGYKPLCSSRNSHCCGRKSWIRKVELVVSTSR